MENIKISRITNVLAESNITTNAYRIGTLFLTPTHVIFTEINGPYENWIPVSHINSVVLLRAFRHKAPLLIKTKTFSSTVFVFGRSQERYLVSESLQQLLVSLGDEELSCLHFKSLDGIPATAGWDIFDPVAEFRRMGVTENCPNWRLVAINTDHEMCDSYPHVLCVPRLAKNHWIQASAKFRLEGRCPVATFVRRESDAALCRCARPDENFSARCIEDERLLVQFSQNNSSGSLLIIDIRSSDEGPASAVAPNNLLEANVTLETASMPCLASLQAAVDDLAVDTQRGDLSSSDYLSSVARSGWLTNVHTLLTLSSRAAERLERGESVLVQCASGVDYTSQVCSLAQLLLDDSCRTLDGFLRLVEKEWLQFSHAFPLRCRHLPGFALDRAGPIFLLFLDAAWQLWRQMPAAFEFNEHLLVILHDHSQGSAFGTFACSCVRQRSKLRLPTRSHSLWGFVTHHRSRFSNSLFCPEAFQGVLRPSLSAKRLRVWSQLFHRCESSLHPRSTTADLIGAARDQTAMWKAQAALLEARIFQLAPRLGISEEKVRKQVAIANSSKICFLSNGSSFEYLPLTNGGSHVTPGSNACVGFSRPSGSSLESGLGGSVDSPTSDLGGTALSPICEAEVAHEDVLNPKDLAALPPLSVLTLQRELCAVRTSWEGLQAAITCSDCGLELHNCEPKRNCFLCARVLCRRCLRLPAGHGPVEFRLMTDNKWRFLLCLQCETAS